MVVNDHPVNLLSKHVSTKFPEPIPNNYPCPSAKDALMERVTYTVAFISGAPNPSTMPVQTAGQKSRLNAVINKAHSL